MAPATHSWTQFLEQYILDVELEFNIGGEAARWAPSTPGRAQKWGEEISYIELKDTAEVSIPETSWCSGS
jgi:hypothetical protein